MCRTRRPRPLPRPPGRPGSSCSPSRWARSRPGPSPWPAAPCSSSEHPFPLLLDELAGGDVGDGPGDVDRPSGRVATHHLAPALDPAHGPVRAADPVLPHVGVLLARGDGGHVGLDGREVRGLHPGQERLDGDLRRVGRQVVDLAVARRDGDGARGRPEVPEAVGASVEDAGHPGLALAERLLGPLPLADVRQDGDDVLDLPARPADAVHRKLGPQHRAVLADEPLVERVPADLAGQQAVELGDVLRDVLRMRQRAPRSSAPVRAGSIRASRTPGR